MTNHSILWNMLSSDKEFHLMQCELILYACCNNYTIYFCILFYIFLFCNFTLIPLSSGQRPNHSRKFMQMSILPKEPISLKLRWFLIFLLQTFLSASWMTSYLKIKFHKFTFLNFNLIAFGGIRNSTYFGILFHFNVL